jgi:hypothetical protein
MRKKRRLVSFDDAVADELMRIRSDLVHIQIKQDKRGWNMIPDDFLQLFWMYCRYPSNFLCVEHKTPNDTWGKIIIVLNDDINIDNFWEVRFDAEQLREINSSGTSEITKGMNLSIFICESNDDNFCAHQRDAKVLSIEEDTSRESIFITLEINLDTIWDDQYWRREEDVGKDIITRKIEIHRFQPSRKWCNFILDKK